MAVPATFGAAWEMEVGWPSRAVLRKKALNHGKGRWLKTVVTCRKSLGCGSSGGASRRVRNDVAGVAGLVDAVAFLGEVVAPVVFEVAVAAKRAEPEDGLGTAESPAGAGEVHPVFDQVAAGAFDDPGGDRPAFRQRGRVVQVPGLVGQVGGAGIRAGPFGAVELGHRGGTPDRAGHPGGTSRRGQPKAWWRTHAAAAGSPSAWQHQAAFHRYSSTWMRSMTTRTDTLRARASAPIRSIWWLFPSTSATQVRWGSGSRRSASSKMRPTTDAASWQQRHSAAPRSPQGAMDVIRRPDTITRADDPRSA